ncbi:MAG: DEAD/DEAH box helicase family protein [Prochloraceae cyanobacterium]|nr:DEAD/DEAH box helicase family protein [Prochloraceae cyanobacterium]
MQTNNYFLSYHQLVKTRIINGATKLYPHQKDALLAIYQKATRGEMTSSYREAALILAGVGTGKTLIQTVTPFILAPWMSGKTALFLSDNCTLRSRFLKDFPTTPKGQPIYDKWLLYSLDILPPGVPPPKIVELDASNFASYAYLMNDADMLVGNRQFVLNLVNRGDIEPNQVGVLVVDEAHFSAASSYRTITNYFEKALLTYFTGSKFRSDSMPLPYVHYEEKEEQTVNGSKIIRYAPRGDFEFSIQDAWKLNPPPIKKITLSEASSEAFLVEEDGVERQYSPNEFFVKAENDRLWFRKILLADSFCLPVLQKAVEILLAKRNATGQPHAMIVRALNIAHAHRVAKLLEENFPMLAGKVGLIHSEHDSFDTAGRASDIMKRFYRGEYWAIVHCGMLGVGTDHKFTSVSCCLCVFKSLSPAEQEWGRIIRSVPGGAPGDVPKLDHPNWGVVVTHSSLKIRPLFNLFLEGQKSDNILSVAKSERVKPVLTTDYNAGETVMTLTDTTHIKPGDVIELATIVEPAPAAAKPKFNLEEELRRTGHLSQTSEKQGIDNVQQQDLDNKNSPMPAIGTIGFVNDKADISKPLPWQKEVDAIGQRLQEIKQVRTFKVQVESVLDSSTVQIVPTWTDVPTGAKVERTRREIVEPNANFLEHVNLDWEIMVDGKLVSHKEYKKRIVLSTKGLSLDAEGDICAGGVCLRKTMPGAVYETFLKGLEAEIETATVEVPMPTGAIARPDLAKMQTQAKYGSQIKGLIYDLFRLNLIRDGQNGNSLVRQPVGLLKEAIDRVVAKGNKPNFKNNQQLIHSAVFGHIKEVTGRSWSEHNEQQYEEAKSIARKYLARLAEEIK